MLLKMLWTDFMTLGGYVRQVSMANRLDFGTDPVMRIRAWIYRYHFPVFPILKDRPSPYLT